MKETIEQTAALPIEAGCIIERQDWQDETGDGNEWLVLEVGNFRSETALKARHIRTNRVEMVFATDARRANGLEIPKDQRQAEERLQGVANQRPEDLAALPKAEFLRAWSALMIICGAHPDDVPNVGEPLEICTENPAFLSPYDKQSGWPIAFIPLGRAAHMRTDLADEELYAYQAGQAGFWGQNS